MRILTVRKKHAAAAVEEKKELRLQKKKGSPGREKEPRISVARKHTHKSIQVAATKKQESRSGKREQCISAARKKKGQV